MQRTMTIHEIDHAIDERLPFEIAYFTKRQVAAKMIVAVRIASRTPQRTFACDLDRQRRLIAGQDATPSRNDPIHPIHVSNYNSRSLVLLDSDDRTKEVEDSWVGCLQHKAHSQEQANHPLRRRKDFESGEPQA